jgi:hypothetical protein
MKKHYVTLPSGFKVTKHFSSSQKKIQNKLECLFVLGQPFLPSLIFASGGEGTFSALFLLYVNGKQKNLITLVVGFKVRKPFS